MKTTFKLAFVACLDDALFGLPCPEAYTGYRPGF